MRAIIKVIIRALALFMFLNLLTYFIMGIANTIVYRLDTDKSYLFMWLAILVFIVSLGGLVFYFMWRKADKFVNIIAGDDLDESAQIITTTNEDLFAVAMKILGIYLLVDSIPKLAGFVAYHLYNTNQNARTGISPEGLPASEFRQLIVQTITFLLAIWLVFGGKKILKPLGNLWKYGEFTHKVEQEEQDSRQTSGYYTINIASPVLTFRHVISNVETFIELTLVGTPDNVVLPTGAPKGNGANGLPQER